MHVRLAHNPPALNRRCAQTSVSDILTRCNPGAVLFVNTRRVFLEALKTGGTLRGSDELV